MQKHTLCVYLSLCPSVSPSLPLPSSIPPSPFLSLSLLQGIGLCNFGAGYASMKSEGQMQNSPEEAEAILHRPDV